MNLKRTMIVAALILIMLAALQSFQVIASSPTHWAPHHQSVGSPRSVLAPSVAFNLMDNGTYPPPIVQSYTLGATEQYIGGTDYTTTTGSVIYELDGSFIPAEDTTAYGLGIYVAGFDPGAKVVLGLYTTGFWNGNEVGNQLLAQTSEIAITAANTWLDASLATPVSLTANTRYWLAIETNGINTVLYYNYPNFPVQWDCTFDTYNPTLPQQFCNWNFNVPGGWTSAYFYSRVIYTPTGPSQTQVDNAINLGLDWMNRHYAPIGSTGYYAVRDHSGVPIYIQRDDGYVRMAGDQQAGACTWAPVPNYCTFSAIPQSSANGQIYELDFETGTDVNPVTNDYNHDDLKFNVIYSALSDTQVQVSITYLLYSPDDGHRWDVYLAGSEIFHGDQTGSGSTFANTAIIDSTSQSGAHEIGLGGRLRAYQFQVSSSTTVSAAWIYISAAGAQFGPAPVVAAIYADNSGLPDGGSKIVQSNPTYQPTSGTWTRFPFQSTMTLNAGYYWLVVESDYAQYQCTTPLDSACGVAGTGTTSTYRYVDFTYSSTFPATFPTGSVSDASEGLLSAKIETPGITVVSPVGSYGWNSFRYVHRHTQQLAESIYAASGDWQKAMQLQQLLSNKGFSTDIYDPMFFKGGSTTANSFPDNFGTWDRTWWDEYIFFNGTWQSWWPQANGGSNAGYAYRSRILGAPTQTQWQTGPLAILPYTPLYQLSRAMQLMNQNPYGFDRPTVQALIDGVNWDGSGVEGSVSGLNYPLGCGPNPHPDSTCIFVGGTAPYSVAGYQEYNTAYFLTAATMYYFYTGDIAYKSQADQAASVLVSAQAKTRVVSTFDYGPIDRPDLYGGFFTGYHTGSVIWKDTGTHGLLEILWGVEDQLGWFIRMGPESGLPVVVSGESTTLAIWALKVYEAYAMGLGWTWNGWNKFASSTTDCTHAGTQCRAISLYEPADIRLYVAGGKGYYATATLRANINAATTITQINLRQYLSGQLVGDSYGAKIEVTIQVFNAQGHSKYSNTRLLYQANAFQTVNVEAGRYDVWTGLNLSATSGWYIVITYKVTTTGRSNQADSAYADFGQSDTPNFSPPVQYFIRVGYLQLNNPLTTPPIAFGA